MKNILIAICLLFGIFSCADDADLNQPSQYDLAIIELFDSSTSDWSGGFSDYPDSIESELNLQINFKNLDDVFSGDNNVLTISGKNPHKDLFYFITRKFSGLEPNTGYQISFTYEFLIEVLDEGEEEFETELYLKAGGTISEPEALEGLDYNSSSQNFVLLNYDKGEGFYDGVANIHFLQQIKEKLSSQNPLKIQGETGSSDIIIQTNSNGEFWGIFGIDSKNDKELAFSFNTILVFVKRI